MTIKYRLRYMLAAGLLLDSPNLDPEAYVPVPMCDECEKEVCAVAPCGLVNSHDNYCHGHPKAPYTTQPLGFWWPEDKPRADARLDQVRLLLRSRINWEVTGGDYLATVITRHLTPSEAELISMIRGRT